MKRLYAEALSYPDVTGLVIGTRPDCVDDEKLEYLAELSQRYFIQVEYGVESCYDHTLKRINRGHDFALSREVIEKSHRLGIRTGAHFIFGLPGESLDEMNDEAAIISTLPVDTIKFHQLQIVKGTRMEREFTANPGDFHPFNLESYIRFIVSFIEHLNPAVVIERFSGEVPPRLLLESTWGLIRYDAVLRLIEKELERQQTWQGRLFS
jgi:radical SAM protein (TIGR01212 family)